MAANLPNPAREETETTIAIFQKIRLNFMSQESLCLNDSIEFLENIKQGCRRTASKNKFRAEITIQPKNNNLDYMIDPTFRNVNRFLSFHSKMVKMILQEMHLINITCH